MRDAVRESWRVLLIIAALALFCWGCAARRCPDPCPSCPPSPAPTPTPHPTPTPTPAPTPTPTPTPTPPTNNCSKIIGPYNCLEPEQGAVAVYQEAVRSALQRITGGRTENSYSVPIQQQITLQLMSDLDASGYCTSYDLQAGNAGAQASEMGVRLAVSGDHNSWFQVFASAGYVRWDGMFRSACYPQADEETIQEVASYWGLPVPPPFGPGPLGRARRPGGRPR